MEHPELRNPDGPPRAGYDCVRCGAPNEGPYANYWHLVVYKDWWIGLLCIDCKGEVRLDPLALEKMLSRAGDA